MQFPHFGIKLVEYLVSLKLDFIFQPFHGNVITFLKRWTSTRIKKKIPMKLKKCNFTCFFREFFDLKDKHFVCSCFKEKERGRMRFYTGVPMFWTFKIKHCFIEKFAIFCFSLMLLDVYRFAVSKRSRNGFIWNQWNKKVS